jgi:Fur family peroxide stress response transcriptional regulator
MIRKQYSAEPMIMETKKREERMMRFRQCCREHGLKMTPKRILIYEELIQSRDHPSPETLFKRVRRKAPQISLDTVYRTLGTFHDIGLVDMVEGFALTRRFDPNQDHHHHARCTRCQAMLDFDSRTYDQLKVPPEIRKVFSVQRVRVTVEGLCRDCAADTEDSSKKSPEGRKPRPHNK